MMLRTWNWRPVDPETGELSEQPERMARLKKIGEFIKVFMHLEENPCYNTRGKKHAFFQDANCSISSSWLLITSTGLLIRNE
jgi:hypothetical protein